MLTYKNNILLKVQYGSRIKHPLKMVETVVITSIVVSFNVHQVLKPKIKFTLIRLDE